MNLGDLRSRVRLRSGIADDDPIFGDTVMTTIINEALRAMSAIHPWPWMEAETTVTVVADATVIPPISNLRGYTSVHRVADNYTLSRVPIDSLNLSKANTVRNVLSSPRVYAPYAGNYYVWPVPTADTDLRVHYVYGTHPALALDTDVPLVPDHSIDMVMAHASLLCARRERDADREKVYYAERAAAVDQALKASEFHADFTTVTNKKGWGG